VTSRFWFTYRRGFNNINGTGPDSDQGWGCMLRCGQMMLAESFLRYYLGRDFRWDAVNNGNPLYWKILNYFRDDKLAPYSVQQIATMGVSEGIAIGKWFGPNTIIQVLNKLSVYDDSNHLRFCIAMDNCVFIDEIHEMQKTCHKLKCARHPKKVCHDWNPLLLVIPLRLGLNEFNETYKEPLKKCFELDQTVGMIGGKPYSAYYFYGYADDDLLYLDPHEVQNYETNLLEDMKDASYHCKTMWKLKFCNLDPSIALGFLCKNKEDFENLMSSLRTINSKSDDSSSMFEIYDTRPKYDASLTDLEVENDSDEDFVFL